MTEKSSAALTIAHAIRWVKESLRPGVLQRAPAGVQRGHRDRAEAGGRRDRAALVHEAHERRRGAADGLGLALGRGGRRGSGAVALDRVLHVVLGHPAARAGAAQGAQVDAVRSGHAGRDRGGVHVAVARRGLCLGVGLDLGHLGGGLHRAVALRRAGAGFDAAQHRADVHGRVGLDQQLGDLPGHRRGDLGVDLVGRDLDERVVDGHGVAHGHPPLEHGALGHGVAHLGEGDVDDLAGGAVVGSGAVVRVRSAVATWRGSAGASPASISPSTAPTGTV